jgi:hypothetical protein
VRLNIMYLCQAALPDNQYNPIRVENRTRHKS